MEEKKKGYITIAGFTISIKALIIVVAIIGAFILISVASSAAKKRQLAEQAAAAAAQRQAEIDARLAAAGTGEPVAFDYDEMMQASLREKYGVPAEGFIWSVTGELVPIGDAEHTAEDIVWIFIRSLSILDFATAQRYSIDSAVASSYQNYFGITSTALTDYRSNFERKVYKYALQSIEIVELGSIAVFADGSETVTVTLNILDLSDKDFWQKDKDTIYQTLRTYSETEIDDTKADQYIYDYIYNAYINGEVGKRQITIDIALSKDNGGGWLVGNDKELDSYLLYDWGTDVADFIRKGYDTWYQEVTLQESLDKIDQQINPDGDNNSEDNSTDNSEEYEGDNNISVEEGTPVEGN